MCNREEKHVGELVMNVLFLLRKDKKKKSAHSLPAPALPKISYQAEPLPQRSADWAFLQTQLEEVSFFR